VGDLHAKPLWSGDFLVSGQVDGDAATHFSILVHTKGDLARLVRGDFLCCRRQARPGHGSLERAGQGMHQQE
jgi:hypothetical protein